MRARPGSDMALLVKSAASGWAISLVLLVTASICRSAQLPAQSGTIETLSSNVQPLVSPELRKTAWEILATAAAVVLIAFQTTAVRDLFWPIEVHAMVQTIDGGLYRASGQSVEPVAAGQNIGRSEVVRTGSDSRAILQLADGAHHDPVEAVYHCGRLFDGVRIGHPRRMPTCFFLAHAISKEHVGRLLQVRRRVFS